MIKNQLNKDKNVLIAEEYFKAGKISSEVRNLLRRKIRVGSSLLDIAEYVEMEIKKRKENIDLGGGGGTATLSGVGTAAH